MQPVYTTLKVNNEIELCEITDMECKQLIERELLRQRISYYIRWQKASFFSRKKNSCIICINDSERERAEDTVRNICDEKGYSVKFIMRKAPNQFL